jgi:large subunit ribosomal protein L2
VRAAGTGAMVSTKQDTNVFLKLRSGWMFRVSVTCMCVFGFASLRKNQWRTAGCLRRMGKRPVVRGVAMNPHDHPHGGGEGKKSPPVMARSPWGWPTKGGATRHRAANKFRYKALRR